MNDDFSALYAYDRWANRRILDACRGLSAEQYVAEPAPGWSSVRATVVHLAASTEGWLRGLKGETVESVPTEAELVTLDDAERHFDLAYRGVDELLPTLSADRLAEPQTLSRRGRTIVLPPWVVLRHLVNHATYHRGQVAAKLKRLGVEPPATDFVIWAFEQAPPG